MSDRTFLDWPFFDAAQRQFAQELEAWAASELDTQQAEGADIDSACRSLVATLGAGGWLRYCVPAAFGGALEKLSVRTLCLARETLARHDGLADFAFAMQGLGSASITLFGSEELKQRYLPRVAAGQHIAAFAMTEPQSGSDVAALTTIARFDGDSYRIDGEKTFISNGGIAHHYVLFARTGEPAQGSRGLSAFVVDADAPGLHIAERIRVSAPHPLARLRFDGCHVPASQRLGQEGEGFRIAMATLDLFRPSVGAAALGFARRALDEALAWSTTRRAFGQTLSEFQLVQAKLADMAVDVDASALLVYRAAWARDCQVERVTREAAMAKLYATEAAQRVVDSAVQLLGGRGVVSGETVERLYREVRALRIYEGTSEIQRLVIARQALAAG
jgi:alkylation response protein AidB-like acyl-CoA dehydrogenase